MALRVFGGKGIGAIKSKVHVYRSRNDMRQSRCIDTQARRVAVKNLRGGKSFLDNCRVDLLKD